MEPTDATEILERYEQAMEALRHALEAWHETLEISEQLRLSVATLFERCVEIKREALRRRLCQQRFPHSLARFLARRWPERWLPWLEGVG